MGLPKEYVHDEKAQRTCQYNAGTDGNGCQKRFRVRHQGNLTPFHLTTSPILYSIQEGFDSRGLLVSLEMVDDCFGQAV